MRDEEFCRNNLLQTIAFCIIILQIRREDF